MGLVYRSLDSSTRALMLDEAESGPHYMSPRLNERGREAWVPLLKDAVAHHNDDWLGLELIRLRYFLSEESYTRNGVTRSREINIPQSAQMLAEGEFNRFYLRGVCRKAANEGRNYLTVYRGKEVSNPRPESEAKIGTEVHAADLLAVLRTTDFVSIGEALAVPGGPNSGISAWLPPV